MAKNSFTTLLKALKKAQKASGEYSWWFWFPQYRYRLQCLEVHRKVYQARWRILLDRKPTQAEIDALMFRHWRMMVQWPGVDRAILTPQTIFGRQFPKRHVGKLEKTMPYPDVVVSFSGGKWQALVTMQMAITKPDNIIEVKAFWDDEALGSEEGLGIIDQGWTIQYNNSVWFVWDDMRQSQRDDVVLGPYPAP
jgi:hypothetical protein